MKKTKHERTKQNKFLKQYISQVKALFPIYGKNERRYLIHLKEYLMDYCEEIPVSSIHTLYEKFGTPLDTVYTYYSIMDTKSLFSSIQICKIIRYFSAMLPFTMLAFYSYKKLS